jgi:hypothetical protein
MLVSYHQDYSVPYYCTPANGDIREEGRRTVANFRVRADGGVHGLYITCNPLPRDELQFSEADQDRCGRFRKA